MAHDSRLVRHDEAIDDLKPSIPDWIKNLQRPAPPCVVPAFGRDTRAATAAREPGSAKPQLQTPGSRARREGLANPEIYEFPEAEGMGHAIRLPANSILQ